MKSLILLLCASAIFVVRPAQAAEATHVTRVLPGMPLSVPSPLSVPCDTQIRYDDGSDDTPGSSPTLGWYNATQFQNLGVLFTPPFGQSHVVQSAGWFAEFWVIPGLVDVTVTDAFNPANTTSATLNVTAGGTWEVQFGKPICIPDGGSYYVMLCPKPGVFGVVSDDRAAPDVRSYVSASVCAPSYLWFPDELDLMIWSCVAPCDVTPTQSGTWGRVKSLYR